MVENFIKLNEKDFYLLCNSDYVNDRADLIVEKLNNNIIIVNGIIYILQNNITYKKCNDIKDDDLIKSVVLSMIENSHKALNQTQKDALSYRNKKYTKLFKNVFINELLPQIKTKLRREIEFDKYSEDEIHFNNGYYNLRKCKLYKRNINKHFITKYINRDYSKSSESDERKIINIIKKIYPNKEDFECIMTILGCSLLGKNDQENNALFLLGIGSSGKSTLMNLLKISLECYVSEIQSNAFELGNNEIKKILVGILENNFIRFIWTNEMTDKRIDATLFKKFTEGSIQTTKLYNDGTFNGKHNATPIFTMNSLPNFIVDSGMTRRILTYTHLSKFTDKREELDENNNIYLKDKTISSNLTNELKNAIFNIICKYSKLYINNGEKINYTTNFLDTKNMVVNSNDTIQDFLDAYFIISNNPNDRVGKNEAYELFTRTHPNKFTTANNILSSFKEKNIKYEWNLTKHSLKGVFLGIRKKTLKELEKDKIENPFIDDDYDYGLEYGIKKDEDKDDKLKIENTKLKKELEEMKKEIEQLKTKNTNNFNHLDFINNLTKEFYKFNKTKKTQIKKEVKKYVKKEELNEEQKKHIEQQLKEFNDDEDENEWEEIEDEKIQITETKDIDDDDLKNIDGQIVFNCL